MGKNKRNKEMEKQSNLLKVMTIEDGRPVACRYFRDTRDLKRYVCDMEGQDSPLWAFFSQVFAALGTTMRNAVAPKDEQDYYYMTTVEPRMLWYRENGVIGEAHEEDTMRRRIALRQVVMQIFPPFTYAEDTGNAARAYLSDGRELTIDRPSGREPLTPMELEALLAMMGGYDVEDGECPTLLPQRMTVTETDNEGNRLFRGEYGNDDADFLLREIQKGHAGFRTQLYQVWQVLSMRVPFFMRRHLAKDSIGVRVGGKGKPFLVMKGDVAPSRMRPIGRLSPTLWRKHGQPEEYERDGRTEYGYRVRVNNDIGVMYLNW